MVYAFRTIFLRPSHTTCVPQNTLEETPQVCFINSKNASVKDRISLLILLHNQACDWRWLFMSGGNSVMLALAGTIKNRILWYERLYQNHLRNLKIYMADTLGGCSHEGLGMCPWKYSQLVLKCSLWSRNPMKSSDVEGFAILKTLPTVLSKY